MRPQSQLPFKLGGLGLPSAQHTRHAAHLASFVDASRTLGILDPSHPVHTALQAFWDETPSIGFPHIVHTRDHRTTPASLHNIANTVKEHLTRIPDVTPPEDLAIVPTSFLQAISAPTKLQHLLTEKQQKVDRAALMRSLSQAGQARITSCSQYGASLIFVLTPSEPRMQVSNDEFAYKLATHLGCPALSKFIAQQAAKCASCGFTTDPVQAPQHAFNCGVGGGPQRRHDLLRNIFASMYRSAHLPTRIEVRAELPESGQGGPDVYVEDYPSAGQKTMFDVAVVNPIQRHFLSTAIGRGLHAAHAKETEKINDHRKTADAIGGRIVPLVFETTGAFGQRTMDALTQFAFVYANRMGASHPPSATAVYPATKPATYWSHILAATHVKGTYYTFRASTPSSGVSSSSSSHQAARNC
jgi:hypothetical protein